MERVMVLGCCGSGKSTFSRKLNQITGLQLFHLDEYYWKPGWKEPDGKVWKETITELSNFDLWIIDGNYGGTIDIRIARADTIIYLDISTITCLFRITKRILKYYRKTRPDMPAGCPERFDLDFYFYVATFNLKRRKGLLNKLNQIQSDKKVIILRSNKEIHLFFNKMNDCNTNSF